MTKDYSHAIAWIENHINPSNFEDDEYSDFVDTARDKFINNELFNNADFMEQLDKLWYEYHEDITDDDIDREIISGTTEIGIDSSRSSSRVTGATVIKEDEAPVKIESNSPIRITPLEKPKVEIPRGVTIITPQETPRQQVSIFRRFINLFRRRR